MRQPQSQAVLASGPQSWNTWSLAAYQSLVAEQQASRITADLTLPESGRVVITPHYRAKDATTALVLEVGAVPKGMYLQLDGAGRALQCTGSPSALQAGRLQVEVTRSPGGWTAQFNNQSLQCTTSDSVGHPAITAGLRRISVHGVSVDGTSSSGPGGKAAGHSDWLAWFALLFGVRRWSGPIALAMAVGACSGWLIMWVDVTPRRDPVLIGIADRCRSPWAPLWLQRSVPSVRAFACR